MADKRKLIDDPNTPYDDTKVMSRVGAGVRRGLETGARLLNAPLPGTRELGMTQTIQGANQQIARGVDDFLGAAAPEVSNRMITSPEPTPAAPARRPRSSLSREDQAAAAQLGQRSADYLGSRKALAPGVRRWGSETADPSDVYMSVDKNGNRVYTDNANFAARQSKGSLSRRDLAPGMLASDADRTLNDPNGGFTYADAPGPESMKYLQAGSRATGGMSAAVEGAASEAARSQAIADTRAGTRDIDKRRIEGGRLTRRNIGMEEEGEGLDPKLLIALQKLDLDERRFAAEREDKKSEGDRQGGQDALDNIKGVSDLLKSVIAGEINPADARDQLASLPGEQGKRGSKGLRRAILQQILAQRDPMFLGDEERQFADPASIRRNADGSGVFTEADSGLFDIQRNIDLSPEELAQIYGDPTDLEGTREDELNTRRRRGY